MNIQSIDISTQKVCQRGCGYLYQYTYIYYISDTKSRLSIPLVLPSTCVCVCTPLGLVCVCVSVCVVAVYDDGIPKGYLVAECENLEHCCCLVPLDLRIPLLTPHQTLPQQIIIVLLVHKMSNLLGHVDKGWGGGHHYENIEILTSVNYYNSTTI